MGVVYRPCDSGGLGPGGGGSKRMLRGDSALPQDVARFRAEAEAAAAAANPRIVPVYAVDVHAGEPFFLMKFIPGTTLARRLAEGPMLAWAAAALLAPVCRAIHYAHERGVLHRDLKPSNILIDDEGRPHVVDFGLAKRLDAGASLTESGAILGTPSYMAPEQARAPSADGRRAIGPACDVYSLGAILYQMITGRPPFQAATALDTILLVLEQDPVPPRVLNPRANPDLEMVALLALPAEGLGEANSRDRRRARPRRPRCVPVPGLPVFARLDQPPHFGRRLPGRDPSRWRSWKIGVSSGYVIASHLVCFLLCHQRALVAASSALGRYVGHLYRRPRGPGQPSSGPAPATGRTDLVRRRSSPMSGAEGDRHQPSRSCSSGS